MLNLRTTASSFLLGLAGLIVLWGSWYTIDQGERGVILRNGAVVSVSEPGLHFKIPVIDSVVTIDTRTNIAVYEKVATYSKDQQPADIRASINYRIEPSAVADVYAVYGAHGILDRVVQPRFYEELKTVFGRFNAITAIQDRGRLNAEVQAKITEALLGTGAVVEGVQIENIDFSDQYEKSIEDRMKAEVEVARLEQNLRREQVQADIVRTQARAKADAVLAHAKADADAIRLKGDADASAIEARGKALRQNPELVGLITAERWNGVLPATMVPGSALPFINLK